MMTEFSIPSIPYQLHWRSQPTSWEVQAVGRLVIGAGPQTDLFSDPAGELLVDTASAVDTAPAAFFRTVDDNFTFSAKVTVDFAATFDAGVLLIWVSESQWAKLCFEYSPQGRPMIVSVVNRGVSDDCNSCALDRGDIFLRIYRDAGTFAFHYSEDGRWWHLVRYFSLGPQSDLRVGFSAQSPRGMGCRVVFSEIGYQVGKLDFIRGGVNNLSEV